MQEAKSELPALEVIDLEEELVAQQEMKMPDLRIHPLAIKEGALLLCTKADKGGCYTVGNHYRVNSVSSDLYIHNQVQVEDDSSDSSSERGHSWCLEALTGDGMFKDHGTQFKLVVWT